MPAFFFRLGAQVCKDPDFAGFPVESSARPGERGLWRRPADGGCPLQDASQCHLAIVVSDDHGAALDDSGVENVAANDGNTPATVQTDIGNG